MGGRGGEKPEMKVRIWARVARAFFNSVGLATLASAIVLIGVTGVNLIALHLQTITAVLYPAITFTAVPVLPAIGLSLVVFFAFLAGGMGIELSKDITATEAEAETQMPRQPGT